MIFSYQGHTRRLHFFDVHEKFSLVDLPGYGQNMPPHYVQSVEPYLRSRPELVAFYHYINCNPSFIMPMVRSQFPPEFFIIHLGSGGART